MSENLLVTSDSVSRSFMNASGSIDYGFTNDYMFHAVLQQNEPVLKSLICAMLHLQPEDIVSIEITNPILPGDSYDSKKFILDIEVVLNDNMLINLEMQVINKRNWPERSLSYLCRLFDQLDKGQDYTECKPAIHIGFLDFHPFPDCSEFYATYKLLNIKNHHLFSDKFTLSVVDLTHIELATDEDRAYGIDHWARLFKATTWEELKMIAKNNPALTDASESLYLLNADELTRSRARAWQEYIVHENAMNRQLEEITTKNEAVVAEKQAIVAEMELLRAKLAQYEDENI